MTSRKKIPQPGNGSDAKLLKSIIEGAPKRVRSLIESHGDPNKPKWYNHRPIWSFALVDHDYLGGWAWSTAGEKLPSVLQFLKNLEQLTWKEIDNQVLHPKKKPGHSKNHPIPIGELCAEAQKRLCDLDLADVDQLHSLRVDYSGRLWGVHVASSGVFCLLWWDSAHKVCPLDSD